MNTDGHFLSAMAVILMVTCGAVTASAFLWFSSAPSPETMKECIIAYRVGLQKGTLSQFSGGGSSIKKEIEKALKEAGCSVGDYETGLKKINSDEQYAKAVAAKLGIPPEFMKRGNELFSR